MFAIIRDTDKVVVGLADFQPDAADLDNRGEFAVETAEAFDIGYIYNPEAGTFATPPETLEQAQARKLRELSQACAAATIGGITCNALGSDHTYPTKRDDQANLDAEVTTAKLYGAAQAPYHFWCAPTGQKTDPTAWIRKEHTAEQIEQVGLAVRSHVKAMQAKYEGARAEVLAATDVAGVDAVVW